MALATRYKGLYRVPFQGKSQEFAKRDRVSKRALFGLMAMSLSLVFLAWGAIAFWTHASVPVVTGVRFRRGSSQDLIVLPVEVDGKGPYGFLFDTDDRAWPVLVSYQLVRSLHLPTAGTTVFTGKTMSGTMTYIPVKVNSIRVAGVGMSHSTAMA
ncbi:MAG TPA: aspartyl protease family protein, partial [Fimbriimonadaceae bacterium]|nr:aspartyl protease family protein [Fimbriimonadaceae bacterium]